MSFRIQRGAIYEAPEIIKDKNRLEGNFQDILNVKIGQKEDVKLSYEELLKFLNSK